MAAEPNPPHTDILLQALQLEQPTLFDRMHTAAVELFPVLGRDECVSQVRVVIREYFNGVISNATTRKEQAAYVPVPREDSANTKAVLLQMQREFEAMDLEEIRKQKVFFCEICQEEQQIHGSFQLDCTHR